MKPCLSLLALALVSVTLTGQAAQSQGKGLEQLLSVPGARATLPVEAAKEPLSKAFVTEARKRYNFFHLLMGGDHALYYLMNLSEFLPTAMSMPATEVAPLERAPSEEVADVVIETTSAGPLSLENYAAHPAFRHQGMMMIHGGKVVFEAYPGMTSTDVHFWASATKTTVGLVAAMLAEEGKIDVSRPVTDYLPELADSAWEQASVLQVLNHTTGLDTEETGASMLDPNSIVVRFFSATFGTPNPSRGLSEDTVTVLRAATPLEAEAPGDVFRYSSANSHVLTMMIEHIEEKPWAAVFEERVWGKLGARMPAMFNLSPDGVALALGLLSTTLEDMGRYGVLFTPSWRKVAAEQVVSDAVLERMQTSGDRQAFAGSVKDRSGVKMFAGERAVANAYQFDWIFEDGAMYKSGKLNQGIYVDPARDFVGVVLSTTPSVAPYGETKAPAFFRAAAKLLAAD